MSAPQLRISTAPFLLSGDTTPRVMRDVVIAVVPVALAAVWFFGLSALLLLLATTFGAAATEWVLQKDRVGFGTLADGSALLTGLLLGLTLPPALPLWMGVLGGAVAIGLGKLVWGGLGQNLFNPALVGRAFLQAAFPTALTTWTAPVKAFGDLASSTLAPPLMHPSVDVVTAATPLALAKFEGQESPLQGLIFGDIGGSMGETAAIILVLAGLWLAWRRVFDWRLPASTLIGVALFSGLLWLLGSGHPSPQFMLLSGGLLFGTVFMVTDPVTTPLTPKGAWIFGLGVGFLVVLIRVYGGLPEGVMYAILLMNSVTPLIDRYTQPRHFGG